MDAELQELGLEPSDLVSSLPIKKVPKGDIFEASRAGDVDRLHLLIESGTNVNARDKWDSVALYYACLAGHLQVAHVLLQNGAICAENTFDGDRCHYAALNLKVRDMLKAYEARPPPLGPLQLALRDTFLACAANTADFKADGGMVTGTSNTNYFPPDIVFYVQGRPIEAHRVVLSARSDFFRTKFQTHWRDRKQVKLSNKKLSFTALYTLFLFFYSDRLEIALNDIEDLIRICKACKCESLQRHLCYELLRHKYGAYKTLSKADNSQKRIIMQGVLLPEEERLPAALFKMLKDSLFVSSAITNPCSTMDSLIFSFGAVRMIDCPDHLADVCVEVDNKLFYCHQVVLAARSEYFRARLSYLNEFNETRNHLTRDTLPCLQERDISVETFKKMMEFMYTDAIKSMDPDQAEELFDAASRYLLFPLKRAVADVLLPQISMASPVELCHWLLLSDLYGVLKIREHCLDRMASNFDTFSNTREFKEMLLALPPPSGESSARTTPPHAPGSATSDVCHGNLLDDLREKWLEAEAEDLDKRDGSALLFDKRLESLVITARKEKQNGLLNTDIFD